MSKSIVREFLRLFGGSGASGNFGQFGSKTAGTPIHTKDVEVIQALDAWGNGWQDAVVSASKAPFLEDMNALFYALCYQLNYILQEGIPEWDSQTTYFVGGVVRRPGTSVMFMSKVDDNLNNALPGTATVPVSNGNWQVMTPTGLSPGIIMAFADSPAPEGWLFCRGDAISRSAFPALFAVIGTTWGAGNGTTTFNVPDLRGRAPFGSDPGSDNFSALGFTAGVINHSHTQAAHAHAIGQLSLGHDTLVTSPFAVTPDQYSQSGGVMGLNPTPSGIGSVQQWSKIQAKTVADNTATAQPPIDAANALPPYAVVNYIIKY